MIWISNNKIISFIEFIIMCRDLDKRYISLDIIFNDGNRRLTEKQLVLIDLELENK